VPALSTKLPDLIIILMHAAAVVVLIFFNKFCCSCCLLACARTAVKIEREHVQGSDDASKNIKPEIEPITEDTVRRMENPGSVEVCKSASSTNNNN